MAEDSEPAKGDSADADEALFKIHYVKGNYFRVIHVDGMLGGMTPAGDGIEVAFYSERLPIPKCSINRFVSEGGDYEEVDTRGRQGVVREVDINAMMTVDTAEKVGYWLLEQVAIARGIRVK